jgi:APA family basic amino acid/polyamine antiporter
VSTPDREAATAGAGSSVRLGLWPAFALVVGHTIGVGVFLTPAEILGTLQSPAWVLGLWLGVGALVLCGALTFGELAARVPSGGGLYGYVRSAWGEGLAALYGWQCVLVLDPGITAALAAGLAGYVAALWPSGPGPRWIAVAAIWLLAVPPILGLRAGARFNSTVTAFKLATIAAFVVLAFGVGSGSWEHVLHAAPRPASARPLAQAAAIGLVGVFYSFGGFWEAARVGDRVRDPRRTAARALILGVTVTTLAYTATTLAFLYLVPASRVTDPAAFASRAGEALLGPRGPAALAAAIVVSAAGSAAALLLMAPHMYLAMAEDGALPRRLVRSDARPSRPTRGTVLLALLASALAALGSFRQIVGFFMFPMLLFLVAAAAALFRLRRREPASPGFRAPLYPLTPILFIALLLAVAAAVAAAQPVPALAGTAVVLAAGAVHALVRPTRPG